MKINELNAHAELQNRNTDALEYIMNCFGRSVYGLVYNILDKFGSKEDIEECVSEIFTQVWDKSDMYSAEKGSFKTWILIQARYKALDYKRNLIKKGMNVSTEEIELPSKIFVENSILRKEEKKQLIAAIDALGDTDREIFYKRYFYYEGIEEIAKGLSLTREAVDNRLSRGRKRIKAALFKYGEGEIV